MVHQSLSQLRKELVDSMFGNVGTIIALRLGPDDAARMAEGSIPVLLKMPEHLSFFRKYVGDFTNPDQTVGLIRIPKLG